MNEPSPNEAVKDVTVDVKILGKDYRIACPEHEQAALSASARYLDQKMREIRGGGRVLGQDKIAVMAALNIAHELTLAETSTHTGSSELSHRIQQIEDKVDQALTTLAKAR